MEQAAEFASWVEIDLDAIAGNVAAVKGLLEPGVRLLAVVKADGYGHGLVPAARVAVARGAEMLGVTHPGDGAALRQAGITTPVLVFRPLLPGEEEAAVQCGLTLSVGSLPQAQRLSAAAGRMRAAGGGAPEDRDRHGAHRFHPRGAAGRPGQAPVPAVPATGGDLHPLCGGLRRPELHQAPVPDL